MAKTIKELAKKFVCENCENDSQCFLTEYAYTSGANAVLNIFDDIIIDNYDNTHDMAVLLIKKIKELKGE